MSQPEERWQQKTAIGSNLGSLMSSPLMKETWTSATGKTMQGFAKLLGSAGTSDPTNESASLGFKIVSPTGKTETYSLSNLSI